MKTIIKYELVINEALRSALNYNTPDVQINEFIRFFGRHIDILQSVYLRNYSLCTPFIRIVCAMSFFTVFENKRRTFHLA